MSRIAKAALDAVVITLFLTAFLRFFVSGAVTLLPGAF